MIEGICRRELRQYFLEVIFHSGRASNKNRFESITSI